MTEPPRIWVDADAAPRPVKDLLYRAAERRGVEVVLVAGQRQHVPSQARVAVILGPEGMDAADDFIAEHCLEGELVVTADLPLAARAVERGAQVLRPRGGMLDADSVGEALAVRDLSSELREAGVMTGGPPAYDAVARQAFADDLDRWITRRMARRPG